MNKQTAKKPRRKSIFGLVFQLIKKVFKLIFLPIKIFFQTLRYVLRWVARYLWHPFKRRWDAMREKTRINKELARMAYKHKFDCVEHLVEVLGGIDNIVTVQAGVRAIYIKVELEFLIELDELESFGFVWHELEKGSLTLTLGFQSPLMAKIINKYVQITRKPRVRKHSSVSAPKLDFTSLILKTKETIIKTKDALLNLKDQLIQLKEKTIIWYEKKRDEFEAWYAKKKAEWKERKIRRAQERKRRKLERDKQRKAKKLMLAAKKKQKAAMQKQRQMKQAAMRKQKASMKQSQSKAKQNARKAKLQSQKGKRPASKGGKRR